MSTFANCRARKEWTSCALLTDIGRRLRKPVVMTAEGDYGNPVLGFDPAADRVVLRTDPQLS